MDCADYSSSVFTGCQDAVVPRYIGQINRNAEKCDKFVFKYELWLLGGFKITVTDIRTYIATFNSRLLMLLTARFLLDLLQCNLFFSYERLHLLHKRLLPAFFKTNFKHPFQQHMFILCGLLISSLFNISTYSSMKPSKLLSLVSPPCTNPSSGYNRQILVRKVLKTYSKLCTKSTLQENVAT